MINYRNFFGRANRKDTKNLGRSGGPATGKLLNVVGIELIDASVQLGQSLEQLKWKRLGTRVYSNSAMNGSLRWQHRAD